MVVIHSLAHQKEAFIVESGAHQTSAEGGSWRDALNNK